MTHERLWAPWRLPYIQGVKPASDAETASFDLPPGADPKCFICQGAADPDCRGRHVIHRAEHWLVMLNRYPYNNGHLLVAPRRHCGRLDELTHQEHCELSEAISRMVNLLERVMSPGGFNIGLNLGQVAGAGLPGHLHWHIVPRWNGDTNFMPAVAAIKVIPQSLDTLWDALTSELQKLAE